MAGELLNCTTICFDADGTLWDLDKLMRYGLARVLAELEQPFNTRPNERNLERAGEKLSVSHSINIRWNHNQLRGWGLNVEA